MTLSSFCHISATQIPELCTRNLTVTSNIQAYDHDIWRIDTAYVEDGVAACYLIRSGDQYALVECGTGLSVAPILAALDALGVARDAVRYIIPTHVHLDHAGGAGGLMQALKNAELHVHPRGLRHLVDPSKLLAGAMAVYGEDSFKRLNGEILACPEERSFAAEDGAVLEFNGRPLRMLDAPGHAKHHLVVWDEHSQGFFTGDVFGLGYPQLAIGEQTFIVPTTTPVQFDPQAWHATLAKMAEYKPRYMYLTHYGRIDNPALLFEELGRRVDEHAALGEQYSDLGEEQLAQRLGDALYAEYQSAGGTQSRSVFDQVLGMDLNLNAQGLLFWQQHKAA